MISGSSRSLLISKIALIQYSPIGAGLVQSEGGKGAVFSAGYCTCDEQMEVTNLFLGTIHRGRKNISLYSQFLDLGIKCLPFDGGDEQHCWL